VLGEEGLLLAEKWFGLFIMPGIKVHWTATAPSAKPDRAHGTWGARAGGRWGATLRSERVAALGAARLPWWATGVGSHGLCSRAASAACAGAFRGLLLLRLAPHCVGGRSGGRGTHTRVPPAVQVQGGSHQAGTGRCVLGCRCRRN
jgi:hypothetical protein